jgi:chorismate mutase/prephenate dehydratase
MLARLRREIDEIDDAVQDLLVRRTDVVAQMRKVKSHDAGIPLRPGREQAVLRRLVARHTGPFPKSALVRIWREIMSASVGLQEPLALAVCVPPNDPGYGELARAHYGAFTPTINFKSPGDVIAAVAEKRSNIGVVPAPHLDDPDPWWRLYLSSGAPLPPVVARLPVTGLGSGPEPDLAAMAVAFAEAEESGNDRALLILETTGAVSRGAVVAGFEKAGMRPLFIDVREAGGEARLILLEVEGFVPADDARLKSVGQGALPIGQVHLLGTYPAPFAPLELDLGG